MVSEPLSAADGGSTLTLAVDGATSSAPGVLRLTGQLGGSAASPDVRGVRVLDDSSPELLSFGEVQDGEVLARSGSSIVGLSVVPSSGGTMSGNLAMGGNKVTGLASGTAPGDAATYGQVTSLLNGLDWQASVLEPTTTPPGSPTTGSRYVVIGVATGAWEGHEEKIAQWNGSSWDFIVPNKGFTVHVESMGQDMVYNGTHPSGAWVNIGTSVDHASLLNLTAGNPHTQYQLAADRETANGYAGLGSDSLPIRPAKAVRTGSDPGSPAPGELWINGSEFKFRNDAGTPATESLERQGRRNQVDGYAGLDGSGRVGASQAPPKSVYATGGGQALVPADIGAVAPGRTITAGRGLSGSGDLSADRTIEIPAFTGLLSRDYNPAEASWTAYETKVHVTYDIGADGMIVPTGLRLPATVNSALETEVVFEFHTESSGTVALTNTNTATTLDGTMQAIADGLMGAVSGAEQNNGKTIRKVIFQTRNTTGDAVTDVDLGPFRIRAYTFPRGAGGAL